MIYTALTPDRGRQGSGGGQEASERTSIKDLRPPRGWGGWEASERTSIKDLRPSGDWGGREASERTSIKGLKPAGYLKVKSSFSLLLFLIICPNSKTIFVIIIMIS